MENIVTVMKLIKNKFSDTCSATKIIENAVPSAWYGTFNFLHLARNEESPRQLREKGDTKKILDTGNQFLYPLVLRLSSSPNERTQFPPHYFARQNLSNIPATPPRVTNKPCQPSSADGSCTLYATYSNPREVRSSGRETETRIEAPLRI